MQNSEEFAEALMMLLSNKEKRKDLGKSAYETFKKKYSADIMTKRYEKYYMDLMGR